MKKLIAILTAIVLSIVAFFSATPIAVAQQILSPVNNFSSLGHTILLAFTLADEVKRIIKEQLDVDDKDIKPEAYIIDDLGADSLGLVELVLAAEEAFEIDIPDEDIEKLRTVQDLVDYVESRKA